MSAHHKPHTDSTHKAALSPFRRAILRGLAIVMPPLLTIVLFLWVWNAIENNVLRPLESGAESAVVWAIADTQSTVPNDLPREVYEDQDFKERQHVNIDSEIYAQLESGKWIPVAVVDTVSRDPRDPDPATAEELYRRYVRMTYLRRAVVIPCFLLIFVVVLYLLGKFMAAGVGRILWTSLEALIHRLPVVRNVYSSVKQVTDFIFSEQTVEFNRVVAVQYPRKGIWSIGFVTGESMLDISAAANEPVLSVLMPTSPMPMTGFTITVAKSETIDLNLTIDQAVQFVVSCGVVVPPQQSTRPEDVRATIVNGVGQRPASASTEGAKPALPAPKSNGDGAAENGAASPEKEPKTSGDD